MDDINNINMEEPKEEQQTTKEPLMDRENNLVKNTSKAKNNSSNVSIINHTSFLALIQKEGKSTRETVQKSHDFIREAMLTLKNEIVGDVLQALNPQLSNFEDLLKEIKNEITNNEENNSDSISVNEEINNEEEMQENLENPAEILRGGEANNREENATNREGNNNNNRGRGGRGRAQNRRSRDSRLFFLLRQIDRERGHEMARDRFRPYYPRGRGDYNNNQYNNNNFRGRNNRGGYRR
ncbi:unnamed protein product [Meloidogyne enterolobii]|uniref:Uncharacterized protein n=2 Tax=Meloidogyne enterolobii TaxID=390850 RepID=A0ACB1AA56_MELEN